jgi:phosphoribosylaminoimidazolecarboxamide formyltransferase/IMP cyclohydrolase
MPDNPIQIKRALISVSDKSGLEIIIPVLAKLNIEIVSTGSTAQVIRDLGAKVKDVSTVTNFKEMLDGRVKTLHPNIHAGLLADTFNKEHLDQLGTMGIDPFQLLIVNLYPFAQTIASVKDFDQCIEQIDVGGPAMVRAAAKNFNSVAVLTSPTQYHSAVSAIDSGGFDYATRKKLASEAFAHTAQYDSVIASWFSGELPSSLNLTATKISELRYGENPQQKAALFVRDGQSNGIANAIQLQGKELSFNNLVDADAAWRAVLEHDLSTVAIIKHTNPCGIASHDDIATAYELAHGCDPTSAFGGVVAANREVTAEFATANANIFTEVIIAPSYTTKALEMLAKRANLRVLAAKPEVDQFEVKMISGGLLVQDIDTFDSTGDLSGNWKLVSGSAADKSTLADLEFAWRSVRAVKSNAIVLAKDLTTVGIGMGQVNRVDSVQLAVQRARLRSQGSVAASDAFFPFKDGVLALIDAGVKAIVHPGGSIRDQEVIEAAESAGVTMYTTGVRHFWH